MQLNQMLNQPNTNIQYMKLMGTINRHAAQLVFFMYILMIFVTPAFYPVVYFYFDEA